MSNPAEKTSPMGRVIKKYEGRSALGPLLLVILGVGMTLASAWAFIDPSLPNYIRGFVVAGVLFAIVGIDGLIKALRQYRLTIYENGFEYSTATENRLVRWSDIVSVWQKILTRGANGPVTQTNYTLLLKDSTKLVLDNERFKDALGLGKTIQHEVTRCLMPEYVRTLNAGGTAQFGKLSMTNQAISNGKESIPWAEVKEVRVRNGVIAIWREDKWLTWSSILASEVPNMFVFLSLVDQIVGVRG
jgi:hypothetical protein